MFKNHLKIALRHFVRHKGHAVLNVSGLAVGMACAILIAAYIDDEVKFDRWHDAASRIYRVTLQLEGFEEGANTPAPLAAALAADYPEIASTVRLFKHWFAPLVACGDKGFIEERVFFADSTFLSVFSFPLLRGDRATALQQPNSVLLTTAAAQKYFGEEDPLGKQLRLNTEIPLTVTGVLADFPNGSHFRPDFIVTFTTLSTMFGPQILQGYGMNGFKTYLLLRPAVSARVLQEKIAHFIPQRINAERKAVLQLQPLAGIHLHSQLSGEFEANSDIQYLYILAAIAFVIMAIAVINYTNLAIAQSAGRSKEVGIRKVIGAHRQSLGAQFIAEALLNVGAALALSVMLAELVAPYVNELSGKQLAPLNFLGGWHLAALLGVTVLVGVLAGSYPAFFITRFQPAAVLKGMTLPGPGRLRLRRSLVILQFSATAVLAVSALVIYAQLQYVKSAKLGFQKEQVLVVRVKDGALTKNPEALRIELLRLSAVKNIAWANAMPGKGHAGDRLRWEGSTDDQFFTASVNWVDENFLPTLGLQLAAGRNFLPLVDFGEASGVLLNEAAVHAIGWSSPAEAVGRTIFGAGTQPGRHQIVGVIKDFNFESLHKQISPLVLFPQTPAAYLLMRVAPAHLQQTLAGIKTVWERFAVAQSFAYSFLNEDFDSLYRAEERWSGLIGAGAVLALLTACLGLLGLASLLVEQKTKEVGIRKVLGASVPGITLLLARQFLQWVLVANIVAWPLAYFMVRRWLEDFAYRVELNLGMFLLPTLAMVVLAFLTISYQAIKTATTNPVQALRYE